MCITREQRVALYRSFMRQERVATYRAFRRLAVPTIGCDGALAVPFCGFWLCIERDGYTHS
jgi:hypothetical protein